LPPCPHLELPASPPLRADPPRWLRFERTRWIGPSVMDPVSNGFVRYQTRPRHEIRGGPRRQSEPDWPDSCPAAPAQGAGRGASFLAKGASARLSMPPV
jgi:hypothetical protein